MVEVQVTRFRQNMGRQFASAQLSFLLAFALIFLSPGVQAQTYTTIYNFRGGTKGAIPTGGLTLDAEGNLYGTTSIGGSGACTGNTGNGCGIVFKLSKAGEMTVLYQFKGGTDGAAPQAALIRDAAGNLYGTTESGGGMGSCSFVGVAGCGTVFKLTPGGKETVLFRFAGGVDGEGPLAGVYMDAAGNLWGTTSFAGYQDAKFCSSLGCGTVFKLTPGGTLTSYPFHGTDGALPMAALVANCEGNLYGTAYEGGTYQAGVLFKVSPSTGKRTILHNFGNSATDAEGPTGLLWSGGVLYGPAVSGGTLQGGAVYQFGGSGEKILYNFQQGNDMSVDFARGVLAMDPGGALYGTTQYQPPDGFGILYKVDLDGNFTDLHDFGGGVDDGANPVAGVIRDSAGNIYGTTQYHGTYGAGTIFKLTP